jgi:hypothetical protein
MKGRKHREAGGVNDAEEDLKTHPEARTNAKKIDDEAEERKAGGRTARKHGGEVHHSRCRCHKCMGGEAKMEHKKEGGKVDGEHEKKRADRKPRKSGGSANATEHPFSSAKDGEAAHGRKLESWMD